MNTRCWCTGPTVSLDDCSHSASGSDHRFAILPHTVAEALVFSRVLRLQLPELPWEIRDIQVLRSCCLYQCLSTAWLVPWGHQVATTKECCLNREESASTQAT